MNEAIKMVQSRDLLLRETSEQFRLPKSTLARRVTGKNKIATDGNKHLDRFQKTFEGDFEEEFVKYIKAMESRFFGLTCIELRQLAFQFAARNRLKHQFNRSKAMACKQWFRLFLKRQTSVCKVPEPTS